MALWEINLITVCPMHGCELIDTCPKCKRHLVWHRSSVSKCVCGYNLSKVDVKEAEPHVLAVTRVIYRAMQSASEHDADISGCGFCTEFLSLSMPSLLKAIHYFGTTFHPSSKSTTKLIYKRNDLRQAMEVVEVAGKAFADWPNNYLEHLRSVNQNYPVSNVFKMCIKQAFGNFYRHLFEVLVEPEYDFIKSTFEYFLGAEWDGLVREHPFVSSNARDSKRWITPQQATEFTDGLSPKAMRKLFDEGLIQGIFKAKGDGKQREVWLDRSSVELWVSESKKWIPRNTAENLLGLNLNCMLALGQAGLIKHRKGRISGGVSKTWNFQEKDVQDIVKAFESHKVPVKRCGGNSQLQISLQHALPAFLDRQQGLPDVIRAVINHELVPIARAGQFKGLRDYIFDTQQLRKFRPIGADVAEGDYLNITEVVRTLGVHQNVVSSLFEAGYIAEPSKCIKGGNRFVLAGEIKTFKEQYFFAKDLASPIDTSVNWVVSYLGGMGVAAHVLKLRSGYNSFFYEKKLLAHLRIPSSKNERISAFIKLLASLQLGWTAGDPPAVSKMGLAK